MAIVGTEQKGSSQTERAPAYGNLERCLERLDRLDGRLDPTAPDGESAAAPLPVLPMLLGQLTESTQRLGNAAGIAPLLGQVREQVEALYLEPGAASLDEAGYAAHMEQLEALFQTLEEVLYACSLPAR